MVNNMITNKHLQDVCLAWDANGGKCRYLEQDNNDYQKFYCLKHRANDKKKIDSKIGSFVKDCKTKGLDPQNQGVPLGDNCGGYPVLKTLQQGYDVDA